MTGEQEAYTPSREWVSVGWAMARTAHGVEHEDAVAEFDRWLAAELADAERRGAEKALMEAAEQGWMRSPQGPEAEEFRDFLIDRAATYRKAE